MQIILHCPFLWSELLPHKSVLLPSQPLPQSSQASFVRLSRHLVHMASSLFWITAWRGFLCCSGMGTTVLVMSDSRFCLPKCPAEEELAKSKTEATRSGEGQVPGNRVTYVAGSWYLGGELRINSQPPLPMTFGDEGWLPCQMMALN